MIRHCIYAVDKNPLAVDLCKVALWIESHSPGLPLSFLDHHVKCGDSLVGIDNLDHLQAGIPDGAFKAIGGDDKAAATAYRRRNRVERRGQLGLGTDPAGLAAWAEDFETFADLEERSPDDVQAKADLYAQLRGDSTRWWDYKTACDLWTYAFFVPLRPSGSDGLARVPTTNDVRDALAGSTRLARLIGVAAETAQTQRFFHWPLEFPDVFQRGGFDVVLGNPPWDQVQLDPREFFETRRPSISRQPNMAARNRAIRALAETHPALHSEYRSALRIADGTKQFIHASGRYPRTSFGRLNTAPLFAEQSLALAARAGRVGVIVPSGIATDSFNQHFFSSLVNSRLLVSLFDFENREGVFPGVHRSYKFCLLTLTARGARGRRRSLLFSCTNRSSLRSVIGASP